MSKIPDHAKRVFKGVIFDIYQWEQELYDGTVKTFEMLKRRNTVMVVALQGDQVLYCLQEQPNKPTFTSLFSGGADDGEEPIETAKRELLEEAGLESDDWHLLRHYPFPSKIDWTVYFFVARNCYKTSQPHLDGGEKIEMQSCSLDDFITKVLAAENFSEYELKQDVFSAFNPTAAEKLKADILG